MAATMAINLAFLTILLSTFIIRMVQPATINNMKGVYNECQSKVKEKYCIGSRTNKTSFPGDGCLGAENCEVVVLALKNNGNPHIFIAHLSEGNATKAKLGGITRVAFTNYAMELREAKEDPLIADNVHFSLGTIFFEVSTGAVESVTASPSNSKYAVLKESSDPDGAIEDTNIRGVVLSQFDTSVRKGIQYTLARFEMKGMVIKEQTDLNKKVVPSVIAYSYAYRSGDRYPNDGPGSYKFVSQISDIPLSNIWNADYRNGSTSLTWLWVILAIAFILLLILLIWCLLRNKKKQKPVSGVDSEATLRSKMPSGTVVSKNPAADGKSVGSKTSATSKTGTSAAGATSAAAGTSKAGTSGTGTTSLNAETSKPGSAAQSNPSKTGSKMNSKTSNPKV